MDEQVAETADHINLQWVSPWSHTLDGLGAVEARLMEARAANVQCVMLDVPMAYETEESVRAYFRALTDAGLIDARICALYPVDEPDLVGHTPAEVQATNAMLRRVMRDFPFTPALPLAVIFTCTRGFPGIESYDWVSCDDYSSREAVLTKYIPQLKARLRPDQRLFLTAGAHQCDDVQPFFDYAQRDLQVIALVAFIWFDNWDGKGAPGLRDLPCRPAYTAAGARIKNPTN